MTRLRRRLVSIPATLAAAIGSLLLLPLWLPALVVTDLFARRRRLPTARLGLFGVQWAWLEAAGIAHTTWLWLTFRAGDRDLHYRLQQRWLDRVVRAVKRSTGAHVEVSGLGALGSGPVVLLCRHVSLADSVISAWVVSTLAGKHPRYVMKRELLNDPCLDIVGNRLPNHFLDRRAADSGAELAALRNLSATMGAADVAVIFPEGTRVSAQKRALGLAKIEEKDPDRARRLAPLAHVLAPRPAGSAALVAGCTEADVVLAWHTGLEGMDSFKGMIERMSRHAPVVRFEMRRVARSEVPEDSEFTPWLDEQWLALDRAVGEMLGEVTVQPVLAGVR